MGNKIMLAIDRIQKWKMSLFFSLFSYSVVLFGIIVVDVFWRRDFDPMEVALITGGFMGSVLILLMIESVVLWRKLSSKV
ncbi:MAG: hypothetical protein K8R64_03675 [Methanosarcinaceae archaeon]|nr:hypothetical protein [Methanosarcinaceae archaeon]